MNSGIASESPATVLSVSALNHAVARMLERTFPLTWVTGEISNFTRAASGHWYFTLKDEAAQVRAVMFRGRAQYAGFVPKEGDRVEVRTLVTLYAARGDYQLSVEAIRRAGIGNLYEDFLQRKAKLEAEGLFDAVRKRRLPPFAKTIGIVTSTQAAALHDILTTLRRRAAHVHVILYPTPVQGNEAAQKIASAINLASRRAECDVLLVCRGGGSIEDLWSFNDENVARAIAACNMPVISGIGHETDFTIADFAADVRAPTPTAAAEMATIPRAEWMTKLQAHADDLTCALRRQLADTTQTLDWLSRRMVSPSAYIAHERLKLQGLHTRLIHGTKVPLAKACFSLMHAQTRLLAQRPELTPQRFLLAENTRRMTTQIGNRITQQRYRLAALTSQLEMLNPQRTLERGYAIVTDAQGKIIRTSTHLHPGKTVMLQLAESTVKVVLSSVQPALM
jgi:exodeoxyribonuclease VII large subunit